MQISKSEIADLVGEKTSFQIWEWRASRIGWALMALIIVAAVLGLWGNGPVSQTEVIGADGRLHVTYERFARNLGETTLEVRFPSGSGRQDTVHLSISQEYMTNNEVMAITPQPDTVTANGDRFVFEFPVRGDSPLTVVFELRPTSTLGVVNVTVGGTSVQPVQFWQAVYP